MFYVCFWQAFSSNELGKLHILSEDTENRSPFFFFPIFNFFIFYANWLLNTWQSQSERRPLKDRAFFFFFFFLGTNFSHYLFFNLISWSVRCRFEMLNELQNHWELMHCFSANPMFIPQIKSRLGLYSGKNYTHTYMKRHDFVVSCVALLHVCNTALLLEHWSMQNSLSNWAEEAAIFMRYLLSGMFLAFLFVCYIYCICFWS